MNNKKNRFSTFQIAKACGISRSTILRLEEEGFITPSDIEDSTGKRFYSFSDAARVIQVMTLRNFGLEKDIIHNFFDGHEDYQICLDVLQERLDNLTRIIRVVKNWQNANEDFNVHKKKIGAMRCFIKKYETDEHLFDFLVKTFAETIKNGYEINITKIPFIQIIPDNEKNTFEIYACIPVLEEICANIAQFQPCRALAIQWHGKITNQADIFNQITEKAKKHGLQNITELRIHVVYDEFTSKNINNNIKVLQFIIPENIAE